MGKGQGQQQQQGRSIKSVLELMGSAAQIRAMVAHLPPGGKLSMTGPGGIARPCTVAEALEQAHQIEQQAEAMFAEHVLVLAAGVAGRLHLGQLVATEDPQGNVHVGPRPALETLQ